MIYYIIALLIGVAYFAVVLALILKYAKKSDVRYCNFLFSVVIFGFYLLDFIDSAIELGGMNIINVFPWSNVSPFTFTLSLLMIIFPQRLKRHFSFLFGLLSLGMTIAAFYTVGSGIVMGSVFFFPFSFFDCMAHFSVCLYGIYTVASGQKKVTVKGSIGSASIIYLAAIGAIVANVFLGTSCFGLSFDETHNIYHVLIIPNAYLSAVVYFIGLTGVILVGYQILKGVEKACAKIEAKQS